MKLIRNPWTRSPLLKWHPGLDLMIISQADHDQDNAWLGQCLVHRGTLIKLQTIPPTTDKYEQDLVAKAAGHVVENEVNLV